jgi:hypothetical protein
MKNLLIGVVMALVFVVIAFDLAVEIFDRFDDNSSGTRTVTVEREASAGPESENGPGQCGRERWAVKTLTDPDAKLVERTVTPSSIDAVSHVPLPKALRVPEFSHRDQPRQPQERKVYRITGNVLGAKLEADSDIHLALADPTGAAETMIVEFPAQTCTSKSQQRAAMLRARDAYVAAYGMPPTTKIDHRITGCVTVTGVAFFDRIHGQFGFAPNGIELHPVTGFRKGC